ASSSPWSSSLHNREQGQLQAVGGTEADVAIVPRCQDRLGELFGTGGDETRRERRAVVHLEGDAYGAGDALTHLDLGARRRLRVVHELERRAAGVEEPDAGFAGRLPRRELG